MYIYATLCIGACTALASCTLCRPRSFLQRRRARPTHECRMWELLGLKPWSAIQWHKSSWCWCQIAHTSWVFLILSHTVYKQDWNCSCLMKQVHHQGDTVWASVHRTAILTVCGGYPPNISVVRFSDRSSQFLTIRLVLLLGAFDK